MFAAAITLVAGALLGLSHMQSLWHFYLLGLVLGVAITGLGDIPAGAVVSRWFGQQRGLALALLPGGLAGPTFAGWVYDRFGSYWPAFAVFAAGNLVAVAGLAASRPDVA